MQFPINNCAGVPINFHPGAFGFQRRVNWHPGVDLYVRDGEPVYAIEKGIVVGNGVFTGPKVGTPFWETTHYLMVEGKTGVFNYGEMYETLFEVGEEIEEEQNLGYVKRVLFEHKLRPDIPGHSCSMLHLELYTHGTTEPVHWHQFQKPPNLLDPTPYLLQMYFDYPSCPSEIANDLNKFQWDNSKIEKVG
jgi:murein DD-endopeptidase MepM/ murein hydrolase activator NlpD